MKKFLSITLCLATILGANAQKTAVDQAKKLASKDLNGARELIRQAIENPETSKDANTYFTAGEMEWGNYDKAKNALVIDPNDSKVNKSEMAKQLVEGYNYYMQVLPLDILPNEKGQVKPRFTKKVVDKIAKHYDDFFNAGAIAYGDKDYNLAYDAFMIHGDMPGMKEFQLKLLTVPDTIRATSYYNAGLSGWAANDLKKVTEAMKKARLTGYEEPEAYIYEIAAWQRLAQDDSTLVSQSEIAIQDAANAGYEKFGLRQPLFINNMINSLITAQKYDEALAKLNPLINENPSSSTLYSLRGFVYDRMNKAEESAQDYCKAADLPDVTPEILKVAANKLLRIGTEKVNLTDRSNRSEMTDIKNKYYVPAQTMLNKAVQMNDGKTDGEIDYLLENVNYALENYF